MVGSQAADLDIFAAEDYRDYIRTRIARTPRSRGLQGRLAEAARCQPSFLSQALAGSVHLTIDHAAGLAKYWSLTKDETRYWLALVQEQRAAHPELKRSCREHRLELRTKQNELSKQLDYPQLRNPSEQARYYRTWLMPAIHIAVSIPKLQTPAALADYFQVRVADVLQALQELEELGLVKRVSPQTWGLSGRFLHLDPSSPFFSTHHINWRFKSASHLQQLGTQDSVHYTSIVSVAASDVKKLEKLAKTFIQEAHAIIAGSREEKLMCLTCDLFGVGTEWNSGAKSGA